MSFSEHPKLAIDIAHQVRIIARTVGKPLSEDEARRVKHMATTVHRILPLVLTEVLLAATGKGKSSVQILLDQFFLHPSHNQMRSIAANLVLINNGLNLEHQNLIIRTIPQLSKKNNDDEPMNAWGYVRVDGITGESENINMERTLFDGLRDDHALSNYIHEASHKYASTEDWNGGIWDNDNEVAGYKNGKMTSFFAIDNADSYGHFCGSVSSVLNL